MQRTLGLIVSFECALTGTRWQTACSLGSSYIANCYRPRKAIVPLLGVAIDDLSDALVSMCRSRRGHTQSRCYRPKMAHSLVAGRTTVRPPSWTECRRDVSAWWPLLANCQLDHCVHNTTANHRHYVPCICSIYQLSVAQACLSSVCMRVKYRVYCEQIKV